MFAISIRNLWEHKLRTLLLGGAIVIGVAFVVAAFVLTDAISESFDSVFADASSGVDIQIIGDPGESAQMGGPMAIPGVPGDLAESIGAVDGVDAVVPTVQGIVTFETGDDASDDPLASFGPPTFGVSWADTASPLQLLEGAAPTAPGHVALDATALDTLEAAIGDTVRIAPSGGRFRDYEVVGEISYGVASGLMGVSFVAFDFDHAVELFDAADEISGYALTVTDPELTTGIVRTLNEDVLPDGVVAADAQNAAEEQSADLQSGLSFITTFLLIFAGIALVVGAFVVYNAFQVVLAQRTRELGLLRVLGASRSDITVSVMGEAALLGLVMGGIGIPVGWALGWAARAAIDAFGGGLPDGGLPLAPRTVVIAVGLGLVVAIASALIPALRANRVAPMAALRDQPELEAPRRWIAWAGVLLVVASLIQLIAVIVDTDEGSILADTSSLTPVLMGTLGLFLGLVLMARLLARSVIGILGKPFRAVTVTLAKENARRTPTRTATTATSLMIGVGLVMLVAILIGSIQTSIDDALADSFAGDLVVGPPGFNPVTTLPAEVAEIVASVDGVASVARTNFTEATDADGTLTLVSGAEADTIHVIMNVDVTDGTFADLTGDSIALSALEARNRGVGLGDALSLTISGDTRDYTVVTIYSMGGAGEEGGLFLPHATLAERTGTPGDAQVVISFSDDADPEATRAGVEDALGDFANLQITSVEDISALVSSGLGGIQVFLTVLLLASVFVALFGIVLTLYLAVFERTREIGLLRAVGMTRSQLSSTIRWEAVFIACFGAVLGLILGLLVGWALTTALIGGSVSLAVPWSWIVGSLIGGALAGFLAAIIPAAAAARLDILRAITYE